MTYRCRSCGQMPCGLRWTGSIRQNRRDRRHNRRPPTLPRMLVTVCCGSSVYDTVVNADTEGLEAMLREKLESGELQEIV